MAEKFIEVAVGRMRPDAPPMVEVSLGETSGAVHRFWFVPQAARDFAVEVVASADQADALRRSEQPAD